MRSSSVIIAEPPPTRQTFFTGQPMLMSTELTPSDSRYSAASRISSGGAEELDGQRTVLSVGLDQFERLAISLDEERALTRSVVHRSTPPISRTTRRKGRLV